jgi:hypothetical protein
MGPQYLVPARWVSECSAMSKLRRPLPLGLAVVVGLSSLVTGFIAALPVAVAEDDGDDGVHDRRLAARAARAAVLLDEAGALFDGRVAPQDPERDATLVLRDLALTRKFLEGVARREADSLLARPTDGAADASGSGYQAGTSPEVACTDTACFHWVESSPDKVNTADLNGSHDGDGVPDYVEEVAGSISTVQQVYLDAGYRAVKADDGLGGNDLPDIYLSNLGADGLYGYCTSDDGVPTSGPYDAWAFCVLDNDYSKVEFPTNEPLENMAVTAAHEYFHAVQFGYDMLEDGWFMEATATWAEDELYDDVDDSLNYLSDSPLARPSWSLDTYGDSGFQYGAWIFFRYLSEALMTEQGGMTTLVRDMWAKADGSSGGPDQYSMQAVASVLRERGTSLPAMFASFADANRRPALTYAEGALNGYPAAPHGRFVKVTGGYTTKLDHLTSSTARFEPEAGTSKLKVILNMPAISTGSGAVVSVYWADGTVQTTTFSLDRAGDGVSKYPFRLGSVRAVEVTLVNASAKYDCWSNGLFSCQGRPVFDDMTTRIKGLVIR